MYCLRYPAGVLSKSDKPALECRFYRLDRGPHHSLFDELGERGEVELLTQKRLLSEKIERAMLRRKMTQAQLAKAMRSIVCWSPEPQG